jgi:transcriptional regulator with XRE-family HTH domain
MANTTARLHQLRDAAGITVDGLAARSGLGRTTVIRALRGGPIRAGTLGSLEIALKLALAERRSSIEEALNSSRLPAA